MLDLHCSRHEALGRFAAGIFWPTLPLKPHCKSPRNTACSQVTAFFSPVQAATHPGTDGNKANKALSQRDCSMAGPSLASPSSGPGS